tara:strand:- start:2384 stop:3139 length:756 start_codon:yes stop_codon:yes gene_type:complete
MAAATAIVGTALSAASTGLSFAQYSKQNKAQKEAEAAAEKAMKDARAKLEENVFKGLDINLKSFERERDALAGVGAQLVTAGQEAERGAAATAGRVAMAATQQAQNIQDREIDALENLERLIAAEESALQKARVDLDLGEVQGAQLAARDAERNKNLALASGVQSLAQLGQGIMGTDPYSDSPERKNKRLENRTTRQNNRATRVAQGETSMAGDTLRDAFGALKSVGGTLLSPLLNVFGVSGGGNVGGAQI